MEQNEQVMERHFRLFNKVAKATYEAIDAENLTDDEKSDPDMGRLVMITILRFSAKLGVKLDLSLKDFLNDAQEMFEAEADIKTKTKTKTKTKNKMKLN